MRDLLPLREIGITARAAVSCLGVGETPHIEALRSGRSGLTQCDFPDARVPCYIGRVSDIEQTALPRSLSAYTNRATQLAVQGIDDTGLHEHISSTVSRWGHDRVGLVIGTSTSGVERLEQVYRSRRGGEPLPRDYQIHHHNDHHAVTAFLSEWLCLGGPAFTVSTACSSSAKAIIDAAQLIQVGICDAVLAGGVDSLCLTSLYGFDALELVSRHPCKPFDVNRDGLSIGEGAGFLLLEREGAGPKLAGYGESSDAINMSTPPPEGEGAAAAMRLALSQARLSPSDIGFVKLHGTATPTNDAAEGAAVASVFPNDVPSVSLKGMIGHTLGAAGALEAVLSLDAMAAGIIPGTVGLATPDPDIPIVANRTLISGDHHHVISNAFGFGGSNCTLVLSAA